MKYKILKHLVEHLVLESKNQESKEKKKKVKFNISSEMGLSSENLKLVKFVNDIHLNSELFTLEMKDSFFIELDHEIDESNTNQNNKIRDELLSLTFPYSRVTIMSMMVNFGYGDLSIPLIDLSERLKDE
nr:MAG TPA: Protein-export protein [Caudoviricetes sp.]